MKAVNLKCEHMSNPMGIDFANPTLSWNCQGGVAQKAYEVIVKCSDDVVYDSGKVESSSMQMKYPNQLQSRQKLTWQVKLWDENDMEETSEEATFEMGLLDVNDWQAKWINPEEKTEPETIAPVSYLRKSVHIDQVLNARL
ncbi:MAG: alpha-L-rhamnosidase, partial [Lachnospiraceae bacterium]|nr:alpha-L-rhamnosidase [Lachnospiraceae bacterium]